ncbi:Uncharacterized protein OnM2_059038 [Erysiphe neolycopersici]|uniref:Coiled-coil domain-containing protein 174 n=1 Tax=Erysiphe neolycopersici TaxID=212602 RepID=A0A420HPW7_9PEZI|nr:Uncharacterized protein OnM2_059038 [Erysiphe neolycopersici]
MTPSTNLYGFPKPQKVPKEISSSNTLAFTSTLTPLISTAQKSSSGRHRPSKKRPNIFKTQKRTYEERNSQNIQNGSRYFSNKNKDVKRQKLEGVDEAILHRSKQKLEAKAKIYAQMKRGEIPENNDILVDFDQKWAEHQDAGSDSDLDAMSDDGQESLIEYEDEFGRARQGTRTEIEKMERQKKVALLSTEELGRMSARPAAPSKINYGDTVQSKAFSLDEPIAAKMEELAAKRDRSLTPPEMRHYEADKEVRSKGVGFYQFSKDEAVREEEMKALEKERLETQKRRKEREDKKKQRLIEIEERRKAIQEKRAIKQADTFLSSLDNELNASESSK